MKKRKKILIIDDEDVFCHSLKISLEDLGIYTVAYETKGKLAIEKAKAFRPDLIVLDVIMLGMNGFRVQKVLKASPVLRDIPLIFLTAKDKESRTITEQTTPGTNKHLMLTKPISIETLTKMIHNII